MTIPYTQKAYAQAQGTSAIPAFLFRDRDPTSSDYNPTYPLYMGWVNTLTKGIWYLEAVNASNGVLTPQWRAVAPIVVSAVPPASPLTNSSDYLYPLGQTWVDSANDTYYVMLSNPTATTGYWVKLSSGGSATENFEVDTFMAPGTDPVVPDGSGTVTVTGGQVAAETTANVIQTNSLAANTYTIQVQRSIAKASTTVGSNGVSHFNSAQFTVDGNGFVSSIADVEKLQGNVGGAVGPNASHIINTLGANGVEVLGDPGTNTLTHYGPVTYTVDPTLGHGNFQTIAAANAVAVAGDVVLIKSGTYTENLVAIPGVVYRGWDCLNFSNPSVIIKGTVSTSGTGISLFSNLSFQSNGGPTVSSTVVGGSMFFEDCNLQNEVGQNIISLSSSSATNIGFERCDVVSLDGSTAAIGGTAGQVTFSRCNCFGNSALIVLTGEMSFGGYYCSLPWAFSTTGSPVGANFLLYYCICFVANNVGWTLGGTTSHQMYFSELVTGASPAITISPGATPLVASHSDFGGFISTTSGSLVIFRDCTTTTSSGVSGEKHRESTVGPAAYPYAVTVNDSIVFVDTSSARTINLLQSGNNGDLVTIKDATGQAGTNNITVTTVGGTITIDGATTRTLNANWQSVTLVFDGSNYLIV